MSNIQLNYYDSKGLPKPFCYLEIDAICDLLAKDCPKRSLSHFLSHFKRYIAISADRNNPLITTNLSYQTLATIDNEINALEFILRSDFDFNEDLQLYKYAHKSEISELLKIKETEQKIEDEKNPAGSSSKI